MLEFPETSSPAPCLGASEGFPSPQSITGTPPSKIQPRTGTYAHKKLQARHHRMAELVAQGVNNKQIAQELSMSQSSVSLNVNSVLVQNQVAALREGRTKLIHEQAIRLKALAPQAVNLYERYINSENDELAPRDKAKLAGDILKSVGLGGEEKKSQTTQIFITAEELAGIKERSAESPKYIESQVVEQTPGPVILGEDSI